MLSKFNAQFIKIGRYIINLNNVCDIHLDWIDCDSKVSGVAIELVNSVTLFFWDKDAEVLRWYFSHPTSKTVDIGNLSGL
ncbi:hypothetical protein NIES2119_09885 [[Phormidium ambiguum] IAM M-71]|uniref:Uncharacterized protein n=1 Tax=[Phormidium ambiguum] IAM M-71 TaxID=454136 RepID=A0A1U7IM92_9CYAN|nr:hypothetical protein [Phormidium ambiguum]OKH38337.1 hypothetical protein NIES2119_09885 [Phormidium ambiguum IAM M-71]